MNKNYSTREWRFLNNKPVILIIIGILIGIGGVFLYEVFGKPAMPEVHCDYVYD